MKDVSPVLSGKPFLKDAGKIHGVNADPVILYGKGHILSHVLSQETDHRFFTPVFYRIDNELIQDEAEPFLIGTDAEITLRQFQNNLILHQQIFVIRNSVVEHI